MSYSTAQLVLTYAIEGVTLAALVFFPLAFAAELVAGFRRHRAALATPAATAAPAAVEPVTEAAIAPEVSIAAETFAAPVLELVGAKRRTDEGLAQLKAGQLKAMTLKDLRAIATRIKLKGRSGFKTKAALVAALAQHSARELFEVELAA